MSKHQEQPEEEEKEGGFLYGVRLMNKFVLYGGLGLFLLSLFLVDVSTFAAVDLSSVLTEAGNQASLGTQSIGTIIASIIQTILGLLGVVFVILIIYSGFLWMTAAGNDERIKMAQGHLRNAIIGVAIVIGAQIITYWVLYNITEAALRGQVEAPAEQGGGSSRGQPDTGGSDTEQEESTGGGIPGPVQ